LKRRYYCPIDISQSPADVLRSSGDCHRRGRGSDVAWIAFATLALVFNDVPGIQSFYGYKLPFEEKAFDTAIAIHVLEHVELNVFS
jgi:hypothetical protein